jgi:hypothetical protein
MHRVAPAAAARRVIGGRIDKRHNIGRCRAERAII